MKSVLQGDGPGLSCDTVYIKMLGGFSIQIGEHTLKDTINRTRQLWNLLEYLIAFRHREVTSQDLLRTLWPNDDCEDPANALKNLVYRLRGMFSSSGLPFAKELIIASCGSYRWNNALPCSVDAEEFEALCKQLDDASLDDWQRHEISERARGLYQGDFLPALCFEAWAVPLCAHYRALYFKCVYISCRFLTAQGRYGELETVCERAVQIDQFEERAQKYLILALAKGGSQSEALERYRHVTDLYYRELGVKPSLTMTELYKEICKRVNKNEQDILAVKADMDSDDEERAALYCEYEVFKNLYRTYTRSVGRTGRPVFLAIITMRTKELEHKEQGVIMDRLLSSLRGSLRRGDVVSRLSQTQYMLLLSALTLEDGLAIMERVKKRFLVDWHLKGIELETAIVAIALE